MGLGRPWDDGEQDDQFTAQQPVFPVVTTKSLSCEFYPNRDKSWCGRPVHGVAYHHDGRKDVPLCAPHMATADTCH
jgi:hypothetical protein